MENKTIQQEVIVRDTPQYKLYSVKAVVIATFFGTPLAGGFLMAKNYERLGNKSYSGRALFFSLLAVMASFILGIVLPENTPQIAIAIPFLLAMRQVMISQQGKMLEQHRHNEGMFESCWKAFGISLLFMMATLLLVLAGISLFDSDFH